MELAAIISTKVAPLIPAEQFKITVGNFPEFADAINRLEIALEKCPKIGETDQMEEHPAIFHYFCESTDIYICEFDQKDSMFGYSILGGDLDNSEWGYFSLEVLRKIPLLNIDYHFNETSIEAALYTAHYGNANIMNLLDTESLAYRFPITGLKEVTYE